MKFACKLIHGGPVHHCFEGLSRRPPNKVPGIMYASKSLYPACLSLSASIAFMALKPLSVGALKQKIKKLKKK